MRLRSSSSRLSTIRHTYRPTIAHAAPHTTTAVCMLERACAPPLGNLRSAFAGGTSAACLPKMSESFSFMRTGLEPAEQSAESLKPFLRKVVSILKVLGEEASATALRFAKACGRTTVDVADNQSSFLQLRWQRQKMYRKEKYKVQVLDITSTKEEEWFV